MAKKIMVSKAKIKVKGLPQLKSIWLESFLPLLVILTMSLGAGYFVFGYLGAIDSDYGRSGSGQMALNTGQLENNYESDFSAVLNDYLQSVSLADSQFIAKTEQLKLKLLALVVPVKYKDKHLSAVLALDKIEAGFQKGDISMVNQELDKIRKSYQTF